MRVLIADDDLTSRALLETTLSRAEYDVIAASDGERAWQALVGADAPRLAIVDWVMPGVDGTEICRRLRRMDAREPTYVILLTIRGSQRDIVVGLDAGADDYITKPFDTSELRARVDVGRRVVGLQSALRQRAEELEEALSNVRTLSGLLPICSYCKKIRNDKGYWQQVDSYIREHSEAELSHGLCPTCMNKHYPDFA